MDIKTTRISAGMGLIAFLGGFSVNSVQDTTKENKAEIKKNKEDIQKNKIEDAKHTILLTQLKDDSDEAKEERKEILKLLKEMRDD